MNELILSATSILVIYCVLVLVASLVGGWLLLALRLTHARLQTGVSFVSGLMLGMALLHFIPHAFHQNHSLDQTMRLVLGGFLVMFFLQRFLPHHHHDVSEGAPELHGPGDAPPVRLQESRASGDSARTLAEQSARQLSWVATTAGMALHSLMGGVALAAAAGTFLCIACADLLPELQFHSHDRLKLSLALAAGLGVAVLIGQFEASGDDHHQPELSLARLCKQAATSLSSLSRGIQE